MDPVLIAQNIYQIAATIYTQAKTVKANQEQCSLLAERVKALEGAIKRLDKLSDSDAYRQNLIRLQTCLREISDYMKNLSGDHWFRRFLHARSHESTFQDFNHRLTLAISELNLGIDAQALINREADQKAAAIDHNLLLTKQDEILKLNQALLTQMNNIPDKAYQQQQHDSIRNRLDQLLRLVVADKKVAAATAGAPAVVTPSSSALDLKALPPPSLGVAPLSPPASSLGIAPCALLNEKAKPLSPPASSYEKAKQFHQQKDYVKARVYYEKAIEEGEQKAIVKFAALLIRGDGGKPAELKNDQMRAVTLFKQAAAVGDPVAISNLVTAYQHGIGMVADAKLAEEWRKKLPASPKKVPHSPSPSAGAAGAHFDSGGMSGEAPSSPRAQSPTPGALSAAVGLMAAPKEALLPRPSLPPLPSATPQLKNQF